MANKWDDQFTARATITELTEENLHEIYLAQIAQMGQLCDTIINCNWYTDSAHDEMTGCLDLLYLLYNNHEHCTITLQELRMAVAMTCCDSVSATTYGMLFDSPDDLHLTEDTTPDNFNPF